jgi:hypothetical protein
MKTKARARAQATRLPNDVAHPPLPHDRDESPETAGGSRRIIQRAAQDVRDGQVDTDNYTRARDITGNADTRRRRTR